MRRINHRISEVLLISFTLFISVNCLISIDDILVTNQHLLVSHSGCVTTFDFAAKPGICPTVFQKPIRPRQKCYNPEANIHLIRDPSGRYPPRIAYIFQTSLHYQIKIQNISVPERSLGENDLNTWTVDMELPTSGTLSLLSLTSDKFSSIYDSNTSLLYLLTYPAYGGLPIVDIFYISNLFSGLKIGIQSMFRGSEFVTHYSKIGTSFKLHSNNGRRFDWTEDVYTNKVYYKEKHDGNKTTTYSLPFEKLMKVLIDGESGDIVFSTEEKRDSFSVSGKVLIERTTTISSSRTNYTVVSYMRSFDNPITKQALMCQYTSNEHISNKRTSSFVIRDEDVCLIKYGSKNHKECVEQKQIWMESKGLIDNGTDVVKWLIVTVIVLTMILVLLMVYIYWLRSTFATDEERTHNEFENEASLFVAKQRSFPSQYPDPALLDISIDKWN